MRGLTAYEFIQELKKDPPNIEAEIHKLEKRIHSYPKNLREQQPEEYLELNRRLDELRARHSKLCECIQIVEKKYKELNDIKDTR